MRTCSTVTACTRLCYCGPVLHSTRTVRGPSHARAPAVWSGNIRSSRHGSRCRGHSALALECLRGAGVKDFSVDLADVRIVRQPVGWGDPWMPAVLHKCMRHWLRKMPPSWPG